MIYYQWKKKFNYYNFDSMVKNVYHTALSDKYYRESGVFYTSNWKKKNVSFTIFIKQQRGTLLMFLTPM